MRAFSGFQGFDYKVMRMPESLEAPELNPADYHRLAVAYGLSFPADEIGQVIPQSQIKDIKIKAPNYDPDDWEPYTPEKLVHQYPPKWQCAIAGFMASSIDFAIVLFGFRGLTRVFVWVAEGFKE